MRSNYSCDSDHHIVCYGMAYTYGICDELAKAPETTTIARGIVKAFLYWRRRIAFLRIVHVVNVCFR